MIHVFIPANWVVARDQFIVNDYSKLTLTKNAPASVTQNTTNLIFNGTDFSVVFDKTSGQMTSYKYKGTEYISDQFGLKPFFWRASTDNDYGAGFLPKKLSAWKDASYTDLKAENLNIKTGRVQSSAMNTTSLKQIQSGKLNTQFIRTVSFMLKIQLMLRNVSYRLYHELECVCSCPVSLSMQNTTAVAPGQYEDRKTSTFVDRYKSPIIDMVDKYVMTQENAHHTDANWLAVTHRLGKGLAFFADDKFQFNVSLSAWKQ